MPLIDQATIARARRRSRAGFHPSYQRLCREVDELLAVELAPAAEPAGYYHDYFCPTHAVELQFDPATPGAHRCPVDGEVHSGEPFDSAWRFGANLMLSSGAVQAALRWRLDDDAASLRRCGDILSAYAKRYPHYPVGRSHTGRGDGRGRACFQSLDESNLLVRLAGAYDLVAEALPAQQRQTIVADLLQPACAHVAAQRFDRIHNIECWHVAALVAAGVVLDDESVVEHALHGPHGYEQLLRDGLDDDGMWWEGSSSYHFYAVAALLATAQICRARELEVGGDERIRAMLLTPLTLLQPDWRLPATNDCWFFSSLLGNVCHGVPPAAALYEIAAGWYDEPRFAAVLARNYRDGARDSVEALLHGPDQVAEAASQALERPRSASLAGSGMTVLRSADRLEEQSTLLLKHGAHGGSHGHPDKLAVSIYVCGTAAAPDLGTPGYGVPLHQSWYRQTAAHNTAMVDGKSQPPATGTVLAFVAAARGADAGSVGLDGRVDGVDGVAAAVTWGDDAGAPYAGVRMRRSTVWTGNGYFIDCLAVHCPHPARVDALLRVRGRLLEEQAGSGKEGADVATATLPAGDGMQHIAPHRQWPADGTVQLSWALASQSPAGEPSGGLTVLALAAGEELLTGAAPFNPASDSTCLLLRTRHGRDALFVSVLHPWRQQPSVADATLETAAGGLQLHVRRGDAVDRWRLTAAASAGENPEPSIGIESGGRE